MLSKLDSGVKLVPPNTPLRSVAFMVAAECWIKNKPENHYTMTLRKELAHLAEHKRFSFEEEPAGVLISPVGSLIRGRKK